MKTLVVGIKPNNQQKIRPCGKPSRSNKSLPQALDTVRGFSCELRIAN